MPPSNANLSLYKNVELESRVADASPHQLIQMLFDELHVLLARAKAVHHADDPQTANALVERAVNIVSYLHQSLIDDVESDLPHNLALLYEYMVRQLLSFRISGAVAVLDEIDSLVETISSGWRDIAGESTP
ncbi:MAG: flagellar export chaperone FliS [Agarilytica sp.]